MRGAESSNDSASLAASVARSLEEVVRRPCPPASLQVYLNLLQCLRPSLDTAYRLGRCYIDAGQVNRGLRLLQSHSVLGGDLFSSQLEGQDGGGDGDVGIDNAEEVPMSPPLNSEGRTGRMTHAEIKLEGLCVACEGLLAGGLVEEAAKVLQDPLSQLFSMGQQDQHSAHHAMGEKSQIRALRTAREAMGLKVGQGYGVCLLSRVCGIRAAAYSACDNLSLAATWYKHSVLLDCRCISSWDALSSGRYLSASELDDFVETVDFGNMTWLKDLYYCRMKEAGIEPLEGNTLELKKRNRVVGCFRRLKGIAGFVNSTEIICREARVMYDRHRTQSAFKLVSKAAVVDPLCEDSLCVHVCCLVELKKVTELYSFAHSLVDARPKAAVSWFAVGAYYFSIGKQDSAQRHFGKCTRLDRNFVEAWVAYGNSFAAADESDQALSSYRAATRLHPGSHVPLLYIGMEYIRTNNRSLARHFLHSAANLNPGDPVAFNELGVIAFKNESYDEAAQYLFHALRLCRRLESEGDDDDLAAAKDNDEDSDQDLRIIATLRDSFWEATISNLGHCFRRLRRYEDSIFCLEVALGLENNAETMAALAFSKHLGGRVEEAIECYHAALAMNPGDSFSSEMLDKALEDALSTEFIDDFDANPEEEEDEENAPSTAVNSFNLGSSIGASGNSTFLSGSNMSDNNDFIDSSGDEHDVVMET